MEKSEDFNNNLRAQQLCRDINKKTKDFYESIKSNENLGYEVLYGPPYFRPPILFIGYQPGGDEDPYPNTNIRKDWPDECEYATAPYTLAKKMRIIFSKDVLLQCVGINAIFLRAKNAREYKQHIAPALEMKIRKFCIPHVNSIIETLQPQKIVVIGIETGKLLGTFEPDLRRLRLPNHNLTMTGSIGSYKALCVSHLSGSRLSNEELKIIGDRINSNDHI